MKKPIVLSAMIASVGLLLSGCTNTKITMNKSSYEPDGMTAVVKGHTDKHNHLTYQIDNGAQHKLAVNDDEFVLQVPANYHDQKVKLTATKDGQKSIKTVTVKKTKPLAKYDDVCQKYNQMIVMSQLSKKELDTLEAAKKVDTNDPMTMMQNQELLKQAQQVKSKISQIQKDSADQELKTDKKGLTNLIKTNAYTLRGNIQDGQLMGGTMIIPTNSFKDKTKSKEFGTTFVAFSQAIGADGKQVMHEFEKETKSQNKTQTTSKTIKNNGITYSIGFSKTALYIYITR